MLKPINLTFERDIRASLPTVWACLTDPKLISQWFFAVDFKPVAGHRFHITGQAVAGWRGWTEVEVLEITPPHCMVWSFDCAEQAPAGRVVFSLNEHAGFVRLVLTHDGLVPEQTLRLLEAGWREYTGNLLTLAEAL
ncbi:SRPBCC domain-containing protein [Mesorhizobium sp. NPDC059054]|uniref:SRPBCC family protein n=1 Tax=Mesorhizobium sp. NPDC059054 TaxID=3346711 RepID=UPI0036D1E214